MSSGEYVSISFSWQEWRRSAKRKAQGAGGYILAKAMRVARRIWRYALSAERLGVAIVDVKEILGDVLV